MERFEVRDHVAHVKGTIWSKWCVWDNQENAVAMMTDRSPALYYGPKGHSYAISRAANLNRNGYTNDNLYTGKWKPGSRGRPPKMVEQAANVVNEPAAQTVSIDPSSFNDAMEKLTAEWSEKFGTLANEARANLNTKLADMGKDVQSALEMKVEDKALEMLAWLEGVKADIEKNTTITIKTERGTVTLGGRQHTTFPKLLKLLSAGLMPLLVGPAGTGKTTACHQAADALGLPFYMQAVGAQTSKADFLGFIDANGNYRPSLFRQAYEHGGVFLCDEIDAGNANVLTVLNGALANGVAGFPDGMVSKHKDFLFIAAANTFGTGANRQYVGRNQLDAATLDRFTSLLWPVDEDLEAFMVQGYENGQRWHEVVKAVRREIDVRQYRVIASPRATQKGAALLDEGFTFAEVLDMTLLAAVGASEKVALETVAKSEWQRADITAWTR